MVVGSKEIELSSDLKIPPGPPSLLDIYLPSSTSAMLCVIHEIFFKFMGKIVPFRFCSFVHSLILLLNSLVMTKGYSSLNSMTDSQHVSPQGIAFVSLYVILGLIALNPSPAIA